MFIRCVTSQWFGATSWVCRLRVWTHRERQRERQATKLSLVATTQAWNYKNLKFCRLSLEKFCCLSHASLWVHFLRFPLILRKDSLSLALSLPVRSHPRGVNALGVDGNRRKCTHRTRATSDKILNFYNLMLALLRQATKLSLVVSRQTILSQN